MNNKATISKISVRGTRCSCMYKNLRSRMIECRKEYIQRIKTCVQNTANNQNQDINICKK